MIDNILEVILKFKKDLKTDSVVVQGEIPCSGIIFNQQTEHYILYKDYIFIKMIEIKNGKLATIITKEYLERTPNHLVGLQII